MGKRQMPWQRHVLDVALEIDPDTGELAYRDVVVTVPRQSGKTTVTLPRVVWRAEAAHLLGGRQTMLYAAQTGIAARSKWEEDFCEDLAAVPIMQGRWRKIGTTGRERIRFKSGSTFGPIATKAESGHGKTLDDGTLDEAFAQVDARVEEAWRPAMITRRNAQFWAVSTAGTAKSLYLKGKVARGRAITELGRSSRTAYFEWSAPKDADPEDPATWWACMPALGHTIRIEDIRHEFETIEGGLPAFRRAYLNQWSDEFDDADWCIPKLSWFACEDETSTRIGPPALALDAAPDRSRASVAYAGARADGLPMTQLIRAGEGTEWAVDEAAKIAREKGATCVVLDGGGPLANKLERLQTALGGVCPVEVLDQGDVANAVGSMHDAIVTEQLRHTGQAELTGALAAAVLIPSGDGRSRFGRRKSGGDISPLYASTLALEGLRRYPDTGSILY
ncbi:hypothetical protein JCM9957A_55880 [Kineosporia succinea]